MLRLLGLIGVVTAVIVPVPRAGVSGGPVLAGTSVVWSRNAPVPEVRRGRTVVWRAQSVPVPAEAARDSFYDVSVEQAVVELAASASTEAFIHTVSLFENPKCRKAPSPCGPPGLLVPVRGELWLARDAGSFRRVAGGSGLPLVTSVDVSSSTAVYAEEPGFDRRSGRLVPGMSRVVLISGGRRTTVAAARTKRFRDARIAGRFAAWLEYDTNGYGEVDFPPLLTVYDRVTGRTRSIAAKVANRRVDAPIIDLAPDGTVAFATGLARPRGCGELVGWLRKGNAIHALSIDGVYARPRVTPRRIAFVAVSCGAQRQTTLTVTNFAGSVRFATTPIRTWSFDFDGSRLAFVGPEGVRVVRLRGT